MKKLHFFKHPIEDVEPYLNHQAERGYKLTKVNNAFYTFEKSDEKKRYQVLYIPTMDPRALSKLLKDLQGAGRKFFFAPINQGNLTVNNMAFPILRRNNNSADTFDTYNQELLILELGPGEEGFKKPDLNMETVVKTYYDLKNTYFYGSILIVVLDVVVLKSLFQNINGFLPVLAIVLILLLTAYYLFAFSNAFDNFKYYSRKKESLSEKKAETVKKKKKK